MKYDKFKNLVENNMPYNPIPGQWGKKGEQRKHILGDPSNEDGKIDLINKYSLLPKVPKIEKKIHLHQYAHHLNSSQIMCYNFFRPLMGEYDGSMYAPSDKLLDLIGILINSNLSSGEAKCQFEYIDNGKFAEKTNFDFYLKSGNTEVFFEIKYTEKEFSKKSSSKDHCKQYEEVYKKMMIDAKDILKNNIIEEYDFSENYYQLARNAIRATTPNRYVFFVCSNVREDMIKQYQSFSDNCLSDVGKQRVRLITWEDLVKDAQSVGIDVSCFNSRYLNFLHT